MKANSHVVGSWGWWDSETGKKTASIDLVAKCGPMQGILQISYVIGGSESMSYVAPLEATPCTYGGVRWWLHCPQCDRRVRCIYLPPGEMRFACRHCHDLAYRSAQEHDKTLARYQRMGLARLQALLEHGDMRAAMAILDMVYNERSYFKR